MVFNNKCVSSPMQVIHVCTRWLRTWSILQKPEDKDLFMMASTRLERMAREVFYPMDGGVIYGYDLPLLRLDTIYCLALYQIILFLGCSGFFGCVHLAMQRPGFLLT